eukprot:c10513_g1_i2 orf=59-1267(+)
MHFLVGPLHAALPLQTEAASGTASPPTTTVKGPFQAGRNSTASPLLIGMPIKSSSVPASSHGAIPPLEEGHAPTHRTPAASAPSMLVFSGGTAFNGVVEELKKLTTHVTHVLPVSDDGGSTAEIVRVLGGPAVGDIRSRCLRLSDESSVEALAVKRLLGHRLPFDSMQAKAEWYTIVEGENYLWEGVSRPYRETIRAFLVYFQNQASQSSNRLPAGIKRIFYMSSEGTNLLHEVFPAVNPTVLEHLKQVQAIVYGMGSLFTSICPSLVLYGVGEVIAEQTCLKILILNGTHDRESFGMSASDFVVSICDALNRKHGVPEKSLNFSATAYINCMLVPNGGAIKVDRDKLTDLGLRKVVTVETTHDEKGSVIYEPRALIQALKHAISSQTGPQMLVSKGGLKES